MRETAQPTRRWTVVAAFFGQSNSRWLDDFIDDPSITFRKQPPVKRMENWHFSKASKTPVGAWFRHFKQARAAFADRPDGLVTCFPQLSMAAAAIKAFGRHKPRIIAYNYNLGGFPKGIKQWVSRSFARQIDIFVVHSPSEVRPYAEYLGVEEDRVRFVPLQRGQISEPRREDVDAPFVLSMGSAHRDYPSLIKAVDKIGVPTTIVTRPSDIDALPKSEYVTFLSRLSEAECMALLARARLSVTPVSNLTTASGQITFINAMQMGVPVIATSCPGTEGYITHDKTGRLVPPFDVDTLASEIKTLWDDEEMRQTLAIAATAESLNRFSDQAAANTLSGMINKLS